jgi:hypothetical protein
MDKISTHREEDYWIRLWAGSLEQQQFKKAHYRQVEFEQACDFFKVPDANIP